ncbi:hypothetical protein PRIPAC_82216 [Pristionchus pacificus]|uniref:G protein-coupled receptor n=1 Tax=Pristionchus pacificus TaxID=54126 RepID=A0A2A6BE03_PRIPA|nr:hypothetical protein PRIPAC_82216 [Pristionchus pacificus]|eukprot:PDM64041.1 G protein-coupled receptor [Pristionchus pacificus]
MFPLSLAFVRTLEVLFSVLNCSIHFIVIRKVLKASVLHPCQRQSLITFEISSIIFSSSHSVDAVIASFRGRIERFPEYKETPGDLLDYIEAILILIALFADYTLWLAQNFCILERTVSTINLDSYDERFRSFKDQTIYFLIFILINILQITFTLLNKYFLVILVVIHASLNFTMSFILLRANRKADKIGSSLGARFQVKENIKILRVFAPLAGLCVFWQIISCILFTIPLFTSDQFINALTSAIFLVTSELYPLSVSSTLLFTNFFGSPCRFRCWKTNDSKIEPDLRKGEATPGERIAPPKTIGEKTSGHISNGDRIKGDRTYGLNTFGART